MNPADLFGVVVRTIGIVSVWYGAWYMLYGLLYRADVLSPNYPEDMKLYLASGIVLLAGGIFMMRGADWFVRFCYPSSKTEAFDEPPAVPPSG